MNKTSWIIIVIIILAGLIWFVFQPNRVTSDYRNATYTIEGKQVTATYFGNELKTDLNGDGREDVAFIVTQNLGGSGTFYYAVVALNTPQGHVGSDGYLLGDQIAPQPTVVSSDARHKSVVVFNYADRAPGEPMTAQPSVAKSVYLKLDPDTMRWAIVLSPEERESL